jgi:hypothetical protein
MKKTSLYLMAIAVAAGSVLSSCKKEKPVTPPVVQEKVCTLTKVFDANSVLQTEYVYENDKLSTINNYSSSGELQNAVNVTYDASNRVSQVENTDSKGSVVSTQTYAYNPSGTINHVSIKSSASDQDVTLNFEYNGIDPKKPSRATFKIDIMGAPMEVGYAEYSYDAKGNNTEAVTYILDFGGSGEFKKQSTASFTYDDKKNPNTALAAIMLQPSLIGPNNVTKETTVDHQNNDNETFTQNTYEYNGENYPVKNTSTDNNAQTTITSMEYTCK